MPPSSPLYGFLYAEDFADDVVVEPVAAPEPEIIDPGFTAAEIDAARAEGRVAGLAEAERGVAAARVQLLGQIAAGLADAAAAASATAEAAAEGVAQCILRALTVCLPELCVRHGAVELQAVLRIVLPRIARQPQVTIRVNPLMLSVVEDELAALDEEAAARVRLLPTDAVPPGDVRITWEDGGVVRDTAAGRAAIEDALAALGLLEREMADA